MSEVRIRSVKRQSITLELGLSFAKLGHLKEFIRQLEQAGATDASEILFTREQVRWEHDL